MQTSLVQEVPQELRPRERLLEYGEKSLSTAELLAIILRTGTKEQNVLHVAMDLLNSFEELCHLKYASIEEIQKIKGIGLVKAVELRAAIEFGLRVSQSSIPKYGKITSTKLAGEWLIQEISDLHQEHLVVLFLNTKNEIMKKQTIFKGTLNSSVAHPREIFKEAIKYPTARIILAHNHPSGDTKPSSADIRFTERMITCGDMMGIEVLDHLIIGAGKFNSLRETTEVFQ